MRSRGKGLISPALGTRSALTTTTPPRAIVSVMTEEYKRLRRLAQRPEKVAVAVGRIFVDMVEKFFIRERGRVVAVEVLRWWRGVTPSLEQHGEVDYLERNVSTRYRYNAMPLHGRFGSRISAVWGLDGLPGTWQERQDKATRLLLRICQKYGDLQGPRALRLVAIEVRNLKIGDGEAGPIYGYQVRVALHTSFQRRLNAIHRFKETRFLK